VSADPRVEAVAAAMVAELTCMEECAQEHAETAVAALDAYDETALRERIAADLERKSHEAIDPRALVKGSAIVHIATGTTHIIDRRKETRDGWWPNDGGGVADSVLTSGGWTTPEALVAALRAEREEVARLLERYEPTPEQMEAVRDRLADLMADADDDPIDALTVERDEARAAVARVRREHPRGTIRGKDVCLACTNLVATRPGGEWPCAKIRALDTGATT